MHGLDGVRHRGHNAGGVYDGRCDLHLFHGLDRHHVRGVRYRILGRSDSDPVHGVGGVRHGLESDGWVHDGRCDLYLRHGLDRHHVHGVCRRLLGRIHPDRVHGLDRVWPRVCH